MDGNRRRRPGRGPGGPDGGASALIDRLVEPGGLRAHVQPIVRIADGETIGYEALCRSVRPERTDPSDWFSIADDLGRRVGLERACLHAVSELGSPPGDALLFVNVSPALLADPGSASQREWLPSRLVLELTERVKGRTPVVAVLGDDASPLVDLADTVIALPFADEQSVVQTRFATTALALFRASLGEDLDAAVADAQAVLDGQASDDPALTDAEQYSFLGMGWTFGLAHEAGLKMRESSQSWTESYSSMEYRHGPIAIAAPGRITWQFGAAPEGLQAQVEATGARFVQHPIDPMAELVRVHRVALDRAVGKGLDPDQPRNLTRSVILDD